MYAIIRTGGKQYKVAAGDEVLVEKLDAEVGAEVAFEVLMLCGDEVVIGKPVVEGVSAKGKVVEQGKGKKVVVFHYKPKKNIRKKAGPSAALYQGRYREHRLMTTITLFSKADGLVGFQAQGHSGYEAAGNDIVCSAISALTTAAANGITQVLGLSAAVEAEDGRLYVMLEKHVSGRDLENARIILDTMALGLGSIAETYGDFIKIIERKV